MSTLANALMGFGAGVQGRGGEFLQGLQQQEQAQQTKKKALDKERQQAAFTDNRVGLGYLKAGQIGQFNKIASERSGYIKKLGGDPVDTDRLIELVEAGEVDKATNWMQDFDKEGVTRGFLAPVERIKVKPKELIDGNYVEMVDGKPVKTKILTGDEAVDPGKYTFGASTTVKDSNGRLFTQTQRRSSRGPMESIIASFDGGEDGPAGKLQIVGTYGLTAAEKVAQIASEEGSRGGAKEITNYKMSAMMAKKLIPDTKKLIKLNNMIKTGKTAPALMLYNSIFNTDSTEAAALGLFNSKSKSMVLGIIKQLGSNPTEGERAFLQEIMPGIASGKVTNAAILEDLLKIQKRQLKRGQWLADHPEATLDDLLLMDDSDFKASYSGGGEQQAAGGTSGAITINSQADYDALQSGDVYLEDGKEYRKP